MPGYAYLRAASAGVICAYLRQNCGSAVAHFRSTAVPTFTGRAEAQFTVDSAAYAAIAQTNRLEIVTYIDVSSVNG